VIINQEYYQATIEHRNDRKCGGFPFENGGFLSGVVSILDARKILEIGTSIGYSAFCFSSNNLKTKVTTIDREQEHYDLATRHWKEYGVDDQIDCIVGESQIVVRGLVEEKNKYDIVFFDGFSPNPDEAKYYIELLKDDGILITTNLNLPSEIMTADTYLEQLRKTGVRTIRKGDISFSSFDQNILESCSKLWDETLKVKK
jgi:predicted O-methyltransferase YrrM